MKNSTYTFLIANAFFMLFALDASAISFNDCVADLAPGYNVPTATNPEDAEGVDMWCSPSTWNEVVDTWYDYGFASMWWDEGWGFHIPCDSTRPLAKALNSHAQIRYASSKSTRLRGHYNGNKRYINRTHAGECKTTPNGRILWGIPFWVSVYYFLPYFYEITNIAVRANSTIHEGRHGQGKPHIPTDDPSCLQADGSFSCCPAGGTSCDLSWEYSGANRWEVDWSMRVIDNEAIRTDKGSGCGPLYARLAADANMNINWRFQTMPNIQLESGYGSCTWTLEEVFFVTWFELPKARIPSWNIPM